jgi:hypothetical protein
MEKLILVAIISLFLFGCDPYYHCYIENNTLDEITIKINPQIADERLESQTSISFLSYAILNLDTFAIYTIEPKSKVRFYGHLSFMPTVRHFPFEFLEVYSTDTLTLDSKESIINHLIEVEKFKFVIMINR